MDTFESIYGSYEEGEDVEGYDESTILNQYSRVLDYSEYENVLSKYVFEARLKETATGKVYEIYGDTVHARMFVLLKHLGLQYLVAPVLIRNVPIEAYECTYKTYLSKHGFLFACDKTEELSVPLIRSRLYVFKGTNLEEVRKELCSQDWAIFSDWIFDGECATNDTVVLTQEISAWFEEQGITDICSMMARVSSHVPNVIREIFGDKSIVNLSTNTCVKQLQEQYCSVDESCNARIRVYEELAKISQSYFYMQGGEFYDIKSDIMHDVLAALYVSQNKRMVSIDTMHSMWTWLRDVSELTSLPFGTKYQKLTRQLHLRDYVLRCNNSGIYPTAFINYEGVMFFGAVTGVRSTIEFLYLPVKVIKQMLGKLGTERNALFNRYRPYVTATVANASSKRINYDSEEFRNGFELLDLNMLTDGKFRILDGTADRSRYDQYMQITSKVGRSEMTRTDPLCEELQKYALWEGVCKLFEQILLRISQSSTGGNKILKYVTLHDFVAMRDSDGEEYIGYAFDQFHWNVNLTNLQYNTSVVLDELKYADLEAVVDLESEIPGKAEKDLRELFNADNIGILTKIGVDLSKFNMLPRNRDLVNLVYPSMNMFVKSAFYFNSGVSDMSSARRNLIEDTLDMFQCEFVDPYNVKFCKVHDALADIISPLSSYYTTSIINIFGGLNTYGTHKLRFFEAGPDRAGNSIPINLNHYRKEIFMNK